MTSESSGSEEARWLVAPPAPGEVSLQLAFGEGREVTPAIQAALDRLMSAIQGEDAQGYLGLDLNLGCIADFVDQKEPNRPGPQCSPLKMVPCAVLVSCRIIK